MVETGRRAVHRVKKMEDEEVENVVSHFREVADKRPSCEWCRTAMMQAVRHWV